MPIYEYECSCCGARFEQRRSFTEDRAAACPRCQGHAHRLLHSVPVIFKGSGFYVTDNPRGNHSSPEVGKTPVASGGESKAPAGSPPTPASKEG